MYTDETILGFGKYKFVKLCRIPPDYFLGMYKDKSYFNKEIREYIENNIELILQRKYGTGKIPEIEMPCEKECFATEKIAKDELRRIRNREQEHKKPIRAYECLVCGGWHLTSKEKW